MTALFDSARELVGYLLARTADLYGRADERFGLALLLCAASAVVIDVIARLIAWHSVRFAEPGRFSLNRFSIIAVFGTTLVFAVAIADPFLIRPGWMIPRIVVGFLIFSVGFLVRYPLRPPFRDRTEWIPSSTLNWILRSHPVRHPRYLGLTVELVGLSVAVGSLAAAATAIGSTVLLACAGILEERRWRKKLKVLHGEDYRDPQPHYECYNLVMPPWLTIVIVSLASMVALALVAVGVRDFQLSSTDLGTSTTLVLGLAGAQATWGLFALSVSLVLAQVVSSSYSIRVAADARAYRLLLGALSALAVSISFDVALVANSSRVFIDGAQERGLLVDLALLLAAGSFAGVAVSLMVTVRSLSVESMVQRSLRALDEAWLRRTVDNWPQVGPIATVSADDRGRGIVDLLRSLLDRSDIETFRFAMVSFKDRLGQVGATSEWIAVDAYLGVLCEPLIRSSAKHTRALEMWLDLAGGLTEFWNPAPFIRTLGHDWERHPVPPGESLASLTTTCAIQVRSEEVASRGMFQIWRRSLKWVAAFPSDQDTADYRSDEEGYSSMSRENRSVLLDNQRAIEIFRFGHLGQVRILGERAIEVNFPDALDTATWVLGSWIDELSQRLSDRPNIRRALIAWCFFELDRLADRLPQNGDWQDHFSLDVDGGLRDLDCTSESDALLAVSIAGHARTLFAKVTKRGRASYGLVSDFRMVGVSASRVNPAATLVVVEGLGDFLQLVAADASADQIRHEALEALRQLHWTVAEFDVGGSVRKRIIFLLDEFTPREPSQRLRRLLDVV